MPRSQRREPAAGNGLRQLLDLETSLAAELRAARQEADAIRARGEEAAHAVRCDGEKTTALEEQALITQIKEQVERESNEIRADLARTKGSLLSTPLERIDTIAKDLLTRLVEGTLGATS